MTLAYGANRQPASTYQPLTSSHLASLPTLISCSSIEAWLEQLTCPLLVPSPSESSENRNFSPHSWSLLSSFPSEKSLSGSPYGMTEPRQSDPCVGPLTPRSLNYGRPVLNACRLLQYHLRRTPYHTPFPQPQPASNLLRRSSLSLLKTPCGLGVDQNEEGALQKYPDFEKLVYSPINQKRESIVNSYPAKKSQQVHYQYYERANEDAFLQNILPMIIKPCRRVKSRVRADAESQEDLEDQEGQRDSFEINMWKDDTTRTHGQVAEQQQEGSDRASVQDQEGPEFSVASFRDDGLTVNVNCQFRKSFLTASQNDEELAKAMAKADGMINTKPDYTYGLRISHYPIPDDMTLSAHTNSLLEVVPTLHHPFFIIEGKSDRGFKAEAEN